MNKLSIQILTLFMVVVFILDILHIYILKSEVFYMFHHASLLHLCLNLLPLYGFGIALKKYAVPIFMLTALTGLLFHVIIADTQLMGASAGVFGIITVYSFYNHRVIDFFGIPFRAKTFVFIVATISFIMMFFDTTIAHAAHFAGIMSGLVLATLSIFKKQV